MTIRLYATQSAPHTPREQKTISLGSAGTVTVQVDVRWLELPHDKFISLRQAISDLEALSEEAPTESVVAADE